MLASIIKQAVIAQVGKLRQERASLAQIILHVGGMETMSLGAQSRSLSPPQQLSMHVGGSHQEGIGWRGLRWARVWGQGHLPCPATLPTSPPPPSATSQKPQEPSPSEPTQYSSVSAPEGGLSPALVPVELK